MAGKNNPDSTLVNVGVLVEPELFQEFDALVKQRYLQKTSVLRRLISDFIETGKFTTEVSNG